MTSDIAPGLESDRRPSRIVGISSPPTKLVDASLGPTTCPAETNRTTPSESHNRSLPRANSTDFNLISRVSPDQKKQFRLAPHTLEQRFTPEDFSFKTNGLGRSPKKWCMKQIIFQLRIKLALSDGTEEMVKSASNPAEDSIFEEQSCLAKGQSALLMTRALLTSQMAKTLLQEWCDEDGCQEEVHILSMQETSHTLTVSLSRFEPDFILNRDPNQSDGHTDVSLWSLLNVHLKALKCSWVMTPIPLEPLSILPNRKHAVQGLRTTYHLLHDGHLAGHSTKDHPPTPVMGPKNDSIKIQMKTYNSNANIILKESSLVLSDVPVTSRLGFLDLVYPDVSRNGLHIKLWLGYFSDFSVDASKMISPSSSGTNIEVLAELKTNTGLVLERVISRGSGEPKVTQYNTMVHRNNQTPTQKPSNSVTRSTFRNRQEEANQNHSGPAPPDRPFVFSHLPLLSTNRTFIPDGEHSLILFKYNEQISMPEVYCRVRVTLAPGQTNPELTPALSKVLIPLKDSSVSPIDGLRILNPRWISTLTITFHPLLPQPICFTRFRICGIIPPPPKTPSSIKVWGYLMRFIVRSRDFQRIKELVGSSSGLMLDAVESKLKVDISTLLAQITNLMTTDSSSIIGTQTLAVQHFTSFLIKLAKVFIPLELLEKANAFCESIKVTKGKIVMWKLLLQEHIVMSPIFDHAEARLQLVPQLTSWAKPHLGEFEDYLMFKPQDNDVFKHSARVTWLEGIRIAVAVIAVALDKLHKVLIDPAICNAVGSLAQEHGNIEYLLGLLPKSLYSIPLKNSKPPPM
ncbi:hypothetical protein PCASD_16547 [Puccinia coronata f. sp. avenae]|uniref:Uncharacterized protein n=1 Tax=Puccinia coronata f. sp. avenae TaxID=200324 RepID=A0A2N5U2P4_9BASI|nr:hypothetical protein PCASD_16547 [Puccinia coronata f. sp. avenae]